ncbi:MAG: hypothetical protein AAFP69_16345, partial [Planctomycetota bacterium]
PAPIDAVLEILEMRARMESRQRFAMLYPLLLLIFCYAGLVHLFGFFLPFYAELKDARLWIDDPLGVAGMQHVGPLVQRWFWLPPVLLVAIWMISGRIIKRKRPGKRARWTLAFYSDCWVFCRLLSTQLRHDIPMHTALIQSADAIDDEGLQTSARQAANDLSKGELAGANAGTYPEPLIDQIMRTHCQQVSASGKTSAGKTTLLESEVDSTAGKTGIAVQVPGITPRALDEVSLWLAARQDRLYQFWVTVVPMVLSLVIAISAIGTYMCFVLIPMYRWLVDAV